MAFVSNQVYLFFGEMHQNTQIENYNDSQKHIVQQKTQVVGNITVFINTVSHKFKRFVLCALLFNDRLTFSYLLL